MKSVVNKIKFQAEFVESNEEKFTPECTVIGIYFGEGDPNNGGEHWNFTQSIGTEEEEDVCTVKEIQQVTIYGGIEKLEMSCNELLCRFHPEASQEIGADELVISYEISLDKWKRLGTMAKKVFRDADYFKIDSIYTA